MKSKAGLGKYNFKICFYRCVDKSNICGAEHEISFQGIIDKFNIAIFSNTCIQSLRNDSVRDLIKCLIEWKKKSWLL